MIRTCRVCPQVCQGLAVEVIGAQQAGVELAREPLGDFSDRGDCIQRQIQRWQIFAVKATAVERSAFA
jgi:hypothetical protein